MNDMYIKHMIHETNIDCAILITVTNHKGDNLLISLE